MRIKRIQIDNVANIKSLDLDLDAFGPSLIAITGENGAGKTHLMEAMLPTALYREWPYYRKSGAKAAKQGEGFIDHVTGVHGRIETDIEYGEHQYNLTLKAQPSIKKQEAYFTIDGEMKNTSGRLPEYDALVGRSFPTPDVLYSAPFATQNSIGSFFRLDRDARRTLFARLLGVEIYEVYAADSMELAKEAQSEIAAIEATIADDIRFMDSNISIEERYSEMEEMVRLNLRPSFIQVFKQYYPLVRTHWLMRDEHDVYLKKLNEKDELERAIQILRDRLGGVQTLPVLDIEATKEKGSRIITRHNNLIKRVLNPLRELVFEYEEGCLVLEKRIRLLREEISRRNEVYPFRFKNIDEAIKATERATDSLEKVDIKHPMCRVCPLTMDAQHALVSNDFLWDELYREEALHNSVLNALTENLSVAEEQRAMLEPIFDRLEQEMYRWELATDTLKADADRLTADIEAYERTQEQQSLAQTMAEELAVLENRLRTLDFPIGEQEQLEAYRKEAGLIYDLESYARTLHGEITGRLEHMQDFIPIMEEITLRRGRCQGAYAKIEELKKLIQTHTDLADFLLHMRSATIEASRPEVEEIANELLMEYREGRFRIEFILAPKKKSKDGKEDFSIRIYDTKTGTYRNSASGGEQSIIDEALRLAFCIVNGNRSGSKFETLFRDETTSALTREYAGSYVQMLRRAQKIGGFHQIIFVTHHETVWRQADVMLEMKDGQVEVGFNNV